MSSYLEYLKINSMLAQALNQQEIVVFWLSLHHSYFTIGHLYDHCLPTMVSDDVAAVLWKGRRPVKEGTFCKQDMDNKYKH